MTPEQIAAEIQKLAALAGKLNESGDKNGALEIQRYIIALNNGATPPPLSAPVVAQAAANGVNVAALATPDARQAAATATSAGGAGAAGNGPFATAAGDPNNRQANQQAQAQVAAVTGQNVTTPTPNPGLGNGAVVAANGIGASTANPGQGVPTPANGAGAPPPGTTPPAGANTGVGTGTSTGANTGVGSGSAIGDTTLGGLDTKGFLDIALRDSGLNPDVLTNASKAAIRGMSPILEALRVNYGAANQGQAGGLSDFIRKMTAQAGDAGGSQNFFGGLQDYAKGILGSTGFQTGVAGLKDQNAAAAMYENLIPLLTAGSNPLFQQEAGDTFERTQRAFNRNDAQRPGASTLQQWLDSQQLTPQQRTIFGR